MRIHARVLRADRGARAGRDRDRGALLRPERAQRARRRPGARRGPARRRPVRAAVLLLHAAADQAGGLRLGRRREGPGPADGRRAARRCRSRPSPTTRPTRWPWPSATPMARRCAPPSRRLAADRESALTGDGGVRSTGITDRDLVAERRGAGPPPRRGRRRRRRRRLPAGGVGRDARQGAAGRQRGAAALAPRPARRRHPPLRLRDRDRARAVPDADRRPGRRPEGRAQAVLSGGPAARAAERDRQRRRAALPGGARDRQADRRADHRRAARRRSPARSPTRSSSPAPPTTRAASRARRCSASATRRREADVAARGQPTARPPRS